MRPGVIGCFQSIHVHPGCHRLRSVAFGPFQCTPGDVGCVRSIPVHFGRHWVRVGVRSVLSRAPWGSSGSFVCVRSIPVFPAGRRVRFG